MSSSCGERRRDVSTMGPERGSPTLFTGRDSVLVTVRHSTLSPPVDREQGNSKEGRVPSPCKVRLPASSRFTTTESLRSGSLTPDVVSLRWSQFVDRPKGGKGNTLKGCLGPTPYYVLLLLRTYFNIQTYKTCYERGYNLPKKKILRS